MTGRRSADLVLEGAASRGSPSWEPDPRDADRTIFARPRGVAWTDFDRTAAQRWLREHPDGPAVTLSP